jgi:hypothetical protein
VCGRGFDPSEHADALYSLASILVFAWLLAATRVVNAGVAAYMMLAAATVLVAVSLYRRRV